MGVRFQWRCGWVTRRDCRSGNTTVERGTRGSARAPRLAARPAAVRGLPPSHHAEGRPLPGLPRCARATRARARAGRRGSASGRRSPTSARRGRSCAGSSSTARALSPATWPRPLRPARPRACSRTRIVPVPSPARRRRARGFCHAALLAEALGQRAGLPVLELLERVGSTDRQVGRARSQRLRTPPRFAALRAGIGPVVLVDDVVTTGATLTACARALREAGCSCEGALAYARTPVR